MGVGIVGCGAISAAYLNAARHFPILDIRAVADIDMSAAERRGAEHGVQARTVDALLADPEIELVVNLTVPKAHVAVGLAALEAGKHVHSEKPLGVELAEARRLVERAERAGLRVGCAPDTFLGGAQQTCRRLIDAGAIGRPIGGTAFFMCPGHEHWHPAPAFYYEKGGGPMLDMGPYYLTALVNLLGPVAEVTGHASRRADTRTIASAPRAGQIIPVEVATHVVGTLAFASGALVQVAMSFDVAAHRHPPCEIYGDDGTLAVPDPNHFGGRVELWDGGAWAPVETDLAYADDDHRIIGAADMAHAIHAGRPHRASGALALHVLEVMEAFGRSADAGLRVEIATRPERPAPLGPDLRDGRLA